MNRRVGRLVGLTGLAALGLFAGNTLAGADDEDRPPQSHQGTDRRPERGEIAQDGDRIPVKVRKNGKWTTIDVVVDRAQHTDAETGLVVEEVTLDPVASSEDASDDGAPDAEQPVLEQTPPEGAEPGEPATDEPAPDQP